MDDGPELPPQVAAKVKALEEQLAAQPKAKALYLQLSALYADHGHKAQAIQALERCLVVDPGNALVKHKLNLLTHAGVGTASATAGLHKPQAPRFVPRAAPARRGVPVWAWIVGGLVLLGAGVAVKLFVFPGTSLVVADTFDATAPQWSPRGDRLAFVQGGTDLAVHDLEKGTTETVARRIWGAFAWSPDGERLAYVAEPAPDASDEEYGESLYVLDLGTRKATRVTSGGSPTWSPDGTRIALLCAGTPPQYEYSGEEALLVRGGTPSGPCVVDVADGRPRMLAVEMAQNLSFAPDRPSLVYESWAEDAMQAAAAEAGPPATLNAQGNDEFQQFAEDAVAGQPRNVYEGSRDLGRRAEALMYDQKKKAAAASGSFFGTDVFVVGDDGSNPLQLTQGGRSGGAHWTGGRPHPVRPGLGIGPAAHDDEPGRLRREAGVLEAGRHRRSRQRGHDPRPQARRLRRSGGGRERGGRVPDVGRVGARPVREPGRRSQPQAAREQAPVQAALRALARRQADRVRGQEQVRQERAVGDVALKGA